MTPKRKAKRPETTQEKRTGANSEYTLAGRLKRARKALGLTQRELSERAAIPLPTLKDHEGGRRIPTGKSIRAYGRAGIHVKWLIEGGDLPMVMTQANGQESSVDVGPDEEGAAPHIGLVDTVLLAEVSRIYIEAMEKELDPFDVMFVGAIYNNVVHLEETGRLEAIKKQVERVVGIRVE